METDDHNGPIVSIDDLGQLRITPPGEHVEHVTVRIDLATGERTETPTYWCAACGDPIDDEPHTDENGEDVHPLCCAECREG